ncbi:MAG: cytochrome c [Candidatus Baltobacteraceae bacterium]
MEFDATTPLDPVSIVVFLDDEPTPVGTYKPPAKVQIDTSELRDGSHVLHIHAVDALGNIGVRDIPFIVSNGPGITVTGLRAGARVRGTVDLNVNAFGADEPFDPVRAESSGPVPVWTWVFFAVIVGWAAWYGLEYFKTPDAFAQTPTYAPNPALAGANAPETASAPVGEASVGPNRATGSKNVAGFDYAALGERVYAQSCQSCHGASGAGVPGAFPALAGDAIVNGPGDAQISIVLHGLSNKAIAGTKYSTQMPSFASQLNDDEIAAAIDHERTSWGNHGPLITPEEVKRRR